MEQHEEIEMQLWEYIDNMCSEAARQRISLLIASDGLWAQKFNEISEFNAGISRGFDLDQPSMRFSKNVMDAVASEHIAPATKKYINSYVVRGIAAFFLLTIVIFTVYVFATTTWNSAVSYHLPAINIKRIDVSPLFNASFVHIAVAINIVVGLVFLDFFLRKKRAHS
jgi:hypothetical protein